MGEKHTSEKSRWAKNINRERWAEILARFIDVLRVNMFMVDASGRVILPPERRKYGGALLADPSLGFDLRCDQPEYLSRFEQYGPYLESANRFDLHCFSVPIYADQQEGESLAPSAYMIVGPVVLNKRLEPTQYVDMAQQYGVAKEDELLSYLTEIKVMSNVAVNSVLDLLSEIIRNHLDTKSTPNSTAGDVDISPEPKEPPHGSSVEFLATLLDLALKMTKAECGSIMVVDEEKKSLIVKIAKGQDDRKIKQAQIKMGEGIAGIAAKENATFHITGQQGDNRIKHLLKRPEIKEAFVMPLLKKEDVFGVLNLHTKKSRNRIKSSMDNLHYLSRLLSFTI